MLNAIRQHRSVRFAAVLAALLAWFVASNRCVLAACAQPEQAKQIHRCCEASAPDQKSPEQKPVLCCKQLAMTVPDDGKVSIAQQPLLELPLFFASLIEATAWADAASPQSGADPPLDARGFAELVLHRSLLAHAPPFLS